MTSSISERTGYALWGLCLVAAIAIWNGAALLFPRGGIWAAVFVVVGLRLCAEAGMIVARRMRR
jgi:energy-converting hydrogenase Eha subunit B